MITAYNNISGTEADVKAHEDDHRVVLEITKDVWVTITPDEFPQLIKMMADILEGMINY